MCQKPAVKNPLTRKKTKCQIHGGRGGPRTAEGRARIGAAQLKHGRTTKAYREAQNTLREQLKQLKTQVRELRNDNNTVLRMQARSAAQECD